MNEFEISVHAGIILVCDMVVQELFRYCAGFTTLTLPDSLTTVGEEVFRYGMGLTSLAIPDSLSE